jgi:hypothetical protein
MATITPATTSGSAITYTAASAGGDTVAFGSATRPIIVVRNASASPITVTLAGVIACSQNFLHNQVVTCPVGDTDIDPQNNVISQAPATYGQVTLTYSATASISVGAISS